MGRGNIFTAITTVVVFVVESEARPGWRRKPETKQWPPVEGAVDSV